MSAHRIIHSRLSSLFVTNILMIPCIERGEVLEAVTVANVVPLLPPYVVTIVMVASFFAGTVVWSNIWHYLSIGLRHLFHSFRDTLVADLFSGVEWHIFSSIKSSRYGP